MIKYDQFKVQLAREIDMVNFLETNEKLTFRQSGNGFRCVEHDSLFIMNDRRGWYWNSQGFGGANAIDWLMKIHSFSFAETLENIVGANYSAAVYTPKIVQKNEFILPEKTLGKYERLFAYLCKTRCISDKIVLELVKKELIYQDIKGNVVFVGYDSEKVPRYAFKRGTFSQINYKREAFGSDKRFAFNVIGKELQKLYVFEAPIDLISHMTISNIMKRDKAACYQHSRIALGGVSDNALEHFLSENGKVEELIFCFDSDETGEKSAYKLMCKYSEKGFLVRKRPPFNKDYNDDLINLTISGRIYK